MVTSNTMNEVDYKYCPSCGGALSERIEYESDRTTVKSWLRYQYHGLNLLRIDEKWDSDGDTDIEETDLWRVMNLYVHGPGQIGQTVRATAYTYTNDETEVPCQTKDYYHFHDALGNVNGVMEDENYYRFETDAFGNDLVEDNGQAGGNPFLAMDSEGLKEHHTGKMFDTTTGLYYFHARWYDAEVGRFVARDPLGETPGGMYGFCRLSPLRYLDTDGARSRTPSGKESAVSLTESEELGLIRECRDEVYSSETWKNGGMACANSAGYMCDRGKRLDQCLKDHGIPGGQDGLDHVHTEIRQFARVPDWVPVLGGGAYHTYCVACTNWSMKSHDLYPGNPMLGGGLPFWVTEYCRTCINLDDTIFIELEFGFYGEASECRTEVGRGECGI